MATPLTADQALILQYLEKHPKEFVSAVAIAQLADDRERYLDDPRWPNLALFQLTEMHLLNIGEDGGYRVRTGRFKKCPAGKQRDRLVSPHIKAILLKHGFCSCLKHRQRQSQNLELQKHLARSV